MGLPTLVVLHPETQMPGADSLPSSPTTRRIMHQKIAKLFRLPALLLAAALQIMPVARAALPAAQATANVFAIVFRWAAGVAAALGGVQAVSGASTVITSPLTTNIVQGKLFALRLTTAPDQAHYWTAK